MTSTESSNGRWRPLRPEDKTILMAVSMPGQIRHNSHVDLTSGPPNKPSNGHTCRVNDHRVVKKKSEDVTSQNKTHSMHESHLPKASSEEKEWMSEINRAFIKIAGDDGQISFDEFKKAIDVKEELFARKFFNYFDEDGSGMIEMKEFMAKTAQISSQTEDDKLKFLFEIFDDNGDGIVTEDELKVVLGACVSESSLRFTSEQLTSLARALLKAADKDNDGTITFDELSEQFNKYPALINNLAISPSNWLKLSKKSKKPSRRSTLRQSIKNTFKNKKPLVSFYSIYLLLTVVCFTVSAILYRSSNWCVMVARGCGMALNFNCMTIGLSMARRTLTYIRNTWLGPYLPIDDHVHIHKFIGVLIAGLSFIHTVAHLGNIGIQISSEKTALSYAEYLFTTKAGVGWIMGSAYISGDILAVVLLLMVLCSLPFVRKSGKFEFFYWTHLLYAVFWVMLIFHGPIFWMWFLLPGILLVTERVYANVVHCMQKTSSTAYFIEEVNLLGSNVTQLVISRPPNFHFRAGDYVFVRIPSVSRWEWHPFSISSAPEQEGVLWLHIRGLGNWSKRLYSFYNSGEYIHSMESCAEEGGMIEKIKNISFGKKNQTAVQRIAVNVHKRPSQPNPLSSTTKPHRQITDRRKIYIDGPFGSAAASITDTNHAILIAAGIGVTPFASVLQSLLTQHRRAQNKASQFMNGPRYGDSFNLKKIDFVWVNRQANDFEWFITLLTQLEMEEARQGAFDRFLDLHLYMTAAKSSSDLKGVGLQMALELVHQEANQDLITGLRTRTKAGRPNWTEIFQTAIKEKRGDIHVYFCGSPALANTVQEACSQFGIGFSHSF